MSKRPRAPRETSWLLATRDQNDVRALEALAAQVRDNGAALSEVTSRLGLDLEETG